MLERWQMAWIGLGATPPPTDEFEKVLKAYEEPHRHYHTLEHLKEMQEQLADIPKVIDRPAMEIAIWYHDLVYNPRSLDNKSASAAAAISAMRKARVPSDKVSHVVHLIESSSHFDVRPQHPDAALFIDLDMWIFAAPDERILQYEKQIREECSYMPDHVYRANRAHSLEHLAARWRLYLTQHCHDSWEFQAKDNLQKLIEMQCEKGAKTE